LPSAAGLLRLEARDFADLTRWRWVLIDEAVGTEVAWHDVRLDATLELAHVHGKPLAAQDVTLVMQSATDDYANDAPCPVAGCASWGCLACRRAGSR
jgi:hypothetical protein